MIRSRTTTIGRSRHLDSVKTGASREAIVVALALLIALALPLGSFAERRAAGGQEGRASEGRPVLREARTATTGPGSTRSPSGRRAASGVPYSLVSGERLLQTLDELTAIGSHSGWRSCGSSGEDQARDYVMQRLSALGFLGGIGLEIEEQSFRTIMGLEVWESRLELEVGGELREVPADALAGHPYYLTVARLFDSDGALEDLAPDPASAFGAVLCITSAQQLASVPAADVEGKVVLLDYALMDPALGEPAAIVDQLRGLMAKEPAGLVLVTTGSSRQGESHGTFAGDSSLMSWAQTDPPTPTLLARIEDMAAAGISGWPDLEGVPAARLTWDADIVSPGSSGNVVARIPGRDSTAAVILSAHLDSPNSPGALDNGSGSAALLEVAEVLDAARIRPEVDVVLAWFGCHERGMHGSPHFAATHQDLLDRTIAMIELDALARPLDGIEDRVNLETRSYQHLGDASLPLPDLLAQEVDRLGLNVLSWDVPGVLSDISGFIGYDVPNALLDNLNIPVMEEMPSLHYAAHWHDPYDTADLAREIKDRFVDLTRILLATALEVARSRPELRVTPTPSHRAVLVGSHTEALHMGPTAMIGLGMVLSWEGFDVDLVPYGRPLVEDDLLGASLVIVLPVVDYPCELLSAHPYDEEWTAAEVSVLESWVASGGRLVLSNSANRLRFYNGRYEPNEDVAAINPVAAAFGVSYDDWPDGSVPLEAWLAESHGGHELVDGVTSLWMATSNGVPFDVRGRPANVLATAGGEPVMTLVEHGSVGGEVLVLADIGLLGDGRIEADNLRLWQNIARWAQ